MIIVETLFQFLSGHSKDVIALAKQNRNKKRDQCLKEKDVATHF